MTGKECTTPHSCSGSQQVQSMTMKVWKLRYNYTYHCIFVYINMAELYVQPLTLAIRSLWLISYS